MKKNMIVKDRYFYRADINRLISKDKDYSDYELKNDTSIFIINELFAEKSVEYIIDELARRYSVDKAIVEKDVIDFLEILYTPRNYKKTFKAIREGIPTDDTISKITYPMSVEIELTKRCNWKCKFCYNVWKHSKTFDNSIDIELNTFKQIIDESVLNGCNLIRLSGGEPTFHPFFYEMVQYASERGCKIALFTNGSNVNEDFIKFIKQNNVIKVLISLHGLEKQHEEFTGVKGSYKNTIDVLKLLIANGIDVSVETLLSGKLDKNSIFIMAKMLKNIGVENWNFMPYVSTGSVEIDEEYKVELKDINYIIKDIIANYQMNIRVVCSQKLCFEAEDDNNYYVDGNCGSGVYWISISHNGQIRNCPHSDVFAGRVSDGIKNIYLSKLKPQLLKIYSQREEKCIACNEYDECKGGCHLAKIGKY